MRVTIKGNLAEKIAKYKNLPSRVKRISCPYIAEQWALKAKKSAKLRAHRTFNSGTSTGSSRINIDAWKSDRDGLIWNVGVRDLRFKRYFDFQESGYTGHWIPVEYIEQHMGNPGQIGVDTRSLNMKPRAWIYAQRGPRPIIEPAIIASEKRLEKVITRGYLMALSEGE